MKTAIVGINWGDEGKGRMVDLLSQEYAIICRYQGGNNAGHTVVNDRGKFVLNLLPSGILRDGCVNIMGNGVVVDLEHLVGEIARIEEQGIAITPDNLKISQRATICMPYHKQMDILEEERLSDHAYGSTRSGIAPVYGDKYMKKSLRMEDLFCDEARLKEKVDALVEWKNLTVKAYGQTLDADAIFQWLLTYGEKVKPFVTDVTAYLQQAIREDKDILFEAQLGALRDIDFGIYPYTTSSQTLASYAPIGSGIPGERVDHTIGIMKAYSSCVGEGPFTAEWFGEEADALREAGGEYGAKTSRPRRVGPVDIPASRYGVMVQGADSIALTKLDVLSYLQEIPVCVAYTIDGVETKEFPTGERLLRAKPVFQTMPGFGDVSACRTKAELPKEALDYIAFLEKEIQCHIRYVSVGAGRDEYIDMDA